MQLIHTCTVNKDHDCAACKLIDLAILVLRWFNKRPEDFTHKFAHEVAAEALKVKITIEKQKGIVRSKSTKTP